MAVVIKSKQNTKTKGKPKKDSVRDKIKKLMEKIDETWVEISVLLADVYENEKYKEWGYERFEDYTNEELFLAYRTAMYRVQFGKLINNLGLDKEKLKKIGWTKMRELLPLMRDEIGKDEAERLIQVAEEKSVRDIKDFVKRVKEEIVSAENIEKVKKVRVTFHFLQDQADTVFLAIERAKELANTDNRALALEYICGEWLESFDESSPAPNEEIEEADEIELE